MTRPLVLLFAFSGLPPLLAPFSAYADFDYSCRCVTNRGCRYDSEILKIKISGPEATAQLLRYPDVVLSFLIDSKFSPDHNVSFYQYLPNPEKADQLPDGPVTLWIEKPLLQGGYRLSTGATGGFITMPGDHPSTFICAVQ